MPTRIETHHNNRADMYINLDAERQLQTSAGYITAAWSNGLETHSRFTSILGSCTKTADVFDTTEELRLDTAARERFELAKYALIEKKRRAQRRLKEKLRDKTAYRDFANEKFRGYLWEGRKLGAMRVHAAVKQFGDPRKIDDERKRKDAYFNLTSVLHDKGIHGSRIAGFDTTDMDQALRVQFNKMHGGWRPAVWAGEMWFYKSKYWYQHAVHVSTDDPTQISYTKDATGLERGIQTRTKPGRYLQKYFSDVLTEEEIRHWAQRQVEANAPVVVTFINNTEPDLWAWAYEHAHGFSSCMQYKHPHDRYLHRDLHGDNHPVRVYAHPENDLALAVLGDNIGDEGGRVVARAIVNQRTKEWVRLYGDDRLKQALLSQGYSLNERCLDGQMLTCKPFLGGHIMPYLDGYVTNVSFGSDSKGHDVFIIEEDGTYDAKNSSGLMDSDTRECGCCGDTYERDEMEYSDYHEEYICSACRSDEYYYAHMRRGQDWVRAGECVYCETDSKWYCREYADYHELVEVYDRWYAMSDCVEAAYGSCEGEYILLENASELPDGNYCHEDDYDEVMEEHFAEEEDETAPVTRPQNPQSNTLSTFKPGDEVKVVRRCASYSNGWDNCWVYSMDRRVGDGRTYSVAIVSTSGVRLEGTSEGFPWKSLVFAEPQQAVVSDEAVQIAA